MEGVAQTPPLLAPWSRLAQGRELCQVLVRGLLGAADQTRPEHDRRRSPFCWRITIRPQTVTDRTRLRVRPRRATPTRGCSSCRPEAPVGRVEGAHTGSRRSVKVSQLEANWAGRPRPTAWSPPPRRIAHRKATRCGGICPRRSLSGRFQSRSHLLEEEHDSLHHVRSLLLQAEERARRADEHLGFAVGHVVVEARALQELPHRVFVGRQVVVWPRKL